MFRASTCPSTMFESKCINDELELIEELSDASPHHDDNNDELSDTSPTEHYTQQLASNLEGILTLLNRYERMENWILDNNSSIISKNPLTPYEQYIYRCVFSNYVQPLPDGRMIIIDPFKLAAVRLSSTSVGATTNSPRLFRAIPSEPSMVASPVSVSNAESVFSTKAFSTKSAFRPILALTRG